MATPSYEVKVFIYIIRLLIKSISSRFQMCLCSVTWLKQYILKKFEMIPNVFMFCFQGARLSFIMILISGWANCLKEAFLHSKRRWFSFYLFQFLYLNSLRNFFLMLTLLVLKMSQFASIFIIRHWHLDPNEAISWLQKPLFCTKMSNH